jgi:signal transduction histidine kinase
VTKRVNATIQAERAVFKPRARLLTLLGDQLIRDPAIAVFELVKNAYDADASRVTVTLYRADEPNIGSIVVQDDGQGMTWQVLMNEWMEPGTDYRANERLRSRRSPKFHRLPLGEKGIGRFAAHKLGSRIELITRSKGQSELRAVMDWSEDDTGRYLSDVPIEIEQRSPSAFRGQKTGTQITVTGLKEEWTRSLVRRLYRQVTSLGSPFADKEPFEISFVINPQSSWVEDLPSVRGILELAPYRFDASITAQRLEYTYEFHSPMQALEDRTVRAVGSEAKELAVTWRRSPTANNDSEPAPADVQSHKIGPIKLSLRVFDLDPDMLSFLSVDRGTLRQILRESGGIRVYRDGIRVYDYGEPGNDWLELGVWRTNRPTARFSNNQVIGAVELQLAESQDLREKTNREGFIENQAYRAFKAAVWDALTQFAAERTADKGRLRLLLKRKGYSEPVADAILELRKAVAERQLERQLGPLIDSLEKEFLETRDRLLTTATSGLSMLVLVHEVEKGILELKLAIERNHETNRLKVLASHLAELIGGMTFLARGSTRRVESARTLVRQALFNVDLRLKYHGIALLNRLEQHDHDFKVTCSRRLIVSTIMNLIDNSIFWLENSGKPTKKLYVDIVSDFDDGHLIVVADNGPGFRDPPQFLVEPFFSRKPDGMGLGLYVANEIVKDHGGRLVFPPPGGLKLPKEITGAVVGLYFPT